MLCREAAVVKMVLRLLAKPPTLWRLGVHLPRSFSPETALALLRGHLWRVVGIPFPWRMNPRGSSWDFCLSGDEDGGVECPLGRAESSEVTPDSGADRARRRTSSSSSGRLGRDDLTSGYPTRPVSHLWWFRAPSQRQQTPVGLCILQSPSEASHRSRGL